MTNADHSSFPIVIPIGAQADYSYGLSKREYFAAKALQGYCAAGSTEMPTEKQLAAMAVVLADALIEELNKEKNEV